MYSGDLSAPGLPARWFKRENIILPARCGLLAIILILVFRLSAEDGSRLWLRYEPLPLPQRLQLIEAVTSVFAEDSHQSIRLAVNELACAYNGFTGQTLQIDKVIKNKAVILVTAGSKTARRFNIDKELLTMHRDGFIIRTMNVFNRQCVVIASPTQQGVLYGTFHWIRLIQTGKFSATYAEQSQPSYDLRMLNHWDNLDGTIERGYAGYSLWKWNDLPGVISPRYAEYARANASVGINAMVPNNVNANPQILSTGYIQKVRTLADVFRPYGIRIFLSINFASPVVLSNLQNADPLNPDVRKWWTAKVAEIYKAIPDFGGFLVKANSEGQPGPMDYGRTHVDGANMLAEAVKPYGGIIIWRAFVYKPASSDRAMQAYNEFMPYDGHFAENVIIQVKNGPVDFQPREPFSPLFGSLIKTPAMIEFQITQEYLGFSNHLVFLGSLFQETFNSDTFVRGPGSTVAKMTDRTHRPNGLTAIAGVSNIGEDTNWCGHHFAQANWYTFGRMAWNNAITADQAADEWIRMTFSDNTQFVADVKTMMLQSHEAVVNYMMPLGLHHLFAWGHHYGPEPWCDVPGARIDWLPRYYHNASENGIGFNRSRNGSGGVDQYNPPLNDIYDSPSSCPEKYLLWFHFLPWTHRLANGRMLWDELCYKYQEGVDAVRNYQKVWDRQEAIIDNERFAHVQSRLKIQTKDAIWWRDACVLYFQTYSRLPIPYELERPIHELDSLKKIKLDLKHHN